VIQQGPAAETQGDVVESNDGHEAAYTKALPAR
jgi:hypothetical protein